MPSWARLTRIEGSRPGLYVTTLGPHLAYPVEGIANMPRRNQTAAGMYDDDRRWHGIRRRFALWIANGLHSMCIWFGLQRAHCWVSGQVLFSFHDDFTAKLRCHCDAIVIDKRNTLRRCTRPAAWASFTTTHPAHETSGKRRESIH
jgi:hypothetical protein